MSKTDLEIKDFKNVQRFPDASTGILHSVTLQRGRAIPRRVSWVLFKQDMELQFLTIYIYMYMDKRALRVHIERI